MNKLQRAWNMYRFGGPDAIILAVTDKITGQNRKDQYIYRMLEKADPADYPVLLEKWYRIYVGGVGPKESKNLQREDTVAEAV